ncbi:cellulose binding domain-containing protein, partial [Embleya sp. NPDC059213]
MAIGTVRRTKRTAPGKRFIAICAALLLPLAAMVGLSAAPAQAAAGATATFAKTSDWGSGFQAEWTIKNTGTTAITSWTVEWDFPTGTNLGSYWDALITKSGTHITAKNREYNGSLAPGASAKFGLLGSGPGSPSNCKVNGGPCDGAPPVDNPPSAPGTPTAT